MSDGSHLTSAAFVTVVGSRANVRRAEIGRLWRDEIPPLEVERDVDQPDQHRHLDQRADDGGEGRARS